MEDFYKAKTNTKISVDVYILSYIKNLNSHQIKTSSSKNKMQEHMMESE